MDGIEAIIVQTTITMVLFPTTVVRAITTMVLLHITAVHAITTMVPLHTTVIRAITTMVPLLTTAVHAITTMVLLLTTAVRAAVTSVVVAEAVLPLLEQWHTTTVHITQPVRVDPAEAVREVQAEAVQVEGMWADQAEVVDGDKFFAEVSLITSF